MFSSASAEEAAAAASKELVVLREAIDRNRTAISQTQHEIMLLRTKQDSERAASEAYAEELRNEMAETLRSLDRMQKMQHGPTVQASELAKAKELLEAKRNELLIAKREVTLLEGVLRIHADTPGLRLREQVRSLYPEIESIALGPKPQQQQQQQQQHSIDQHGGQQYENIHSQNHLNDHNSNSTAAGGGVPTQSNNPPVPAPVPGPGGVSPPTNKMLRDDLL